MAVISISREMGSQGRAIGQRAAAALGYHFVDKGTIEKVLLEYGIVRFKDVYDSAPGFWSLFDARRAEIVDLLNRVMQAFAAHGNVVILGRGGFAVLEGFEDALNLRIQAALPVRVRQVMDEEQIGDLQTAETLVRKSDQLRAAFVESSYNVRWDTTGLFNLVIDTGIISADLATRWLVEAARDLQAGSDEEERAARRLAVDPILAEVIAKVLDCQVTH